MNSSSTTPLSARMKACRMAMPPPSSRTMRAPIASLPTRPAVRRGLEDRRHDHEREHQVDDQQRAGEGAVARDEPSQSTPNISARKSPSSRARRGSRRAPGAPSSSDRTSRVTASPVTIPRSSGPPCRSRPEPTGDAPSGAVRTVSRSIPPERAARRGGGQHVGSRRGSGRPAVRPAGRVGPAGRPRGPPPPLAAGQRRADPAVPGRRRGPVRDHARPPARSRSATGCRSRCPGRGCASPAPGGTC